MIPDEVISGRSSYNERVVEKRFHKLGFKPERLDVRGSKRKRPDFLVHDGSGALLLCEVKTIFSAGYMPERHAQVSLDDPNFLNSGPIGIDIDFRRIDDCLANAVSKAHALYEDRPDLEGIPLTVALFLDFFADYFRLYPKRMERFPEVSGILKVEADHLIREALDKMTLDELRARMESESAEGLPPRTKVFRLLQNECATTPLPAHFVAMCLTE